MLLGHDVFNDEWRVIDQGLLKPAVLATALRSCENRFPCLRIHFRFGVWMPTAFGPWLSEHQ
jgi:hypothetical protein